MRTGWTVGSPKAINRQERPCIRRRRHKTCTVIVHHRNPVQPSAATSSAKQPPKQRRTHPTLTNFIPPHSTDPTAYHHKRPGDQARPWQMGLGNQRETSKQRPSIQPRLWWTQSGSAALGIVTGPFRKRPEDLETKPRLATRQNRNTSNPSHVDPGPDPESRIIPARLSPVTCTEASESPTPLVTNAFRRRNTDTMG